MNVVLDLVLCEKVVEQINKYVHMLFEIVMFYMRMYVYVDMVVVMLLHVLKVNIFDEVV
jgi:hypothetical protein